MDDLPELPFEKVLSYLSLEDLLKSRAVSRRWYWMINRFKVKTLCYSQRPAGFIKGKHRLVSGAFAKNFISSTRFVSFFNTFGQKILSNLKHLRLCDLRLNAETMPAFFSTLQSFGQLEELDIIRFTCPFSTAEEEIKLSLLMLTSIWLKEVHGIKKLTLDAPRLLKINVCDSFDLNLELVHAESVKQLRTDKWSVIAVKKLKNLRYLYERSFKRIDSTFLSSLEQLKEVHLKQPVMISELFEQKQRNGRADPKVYLQGVLLSGPDDSAIDSLGYYYPDEYSDEYDEDFDLPFENPSRLADEIPFWQRIYYSEIKCIAPELQINVLKRFSDLNEIFVEEPVQDIESFLNLLKNLHNIVRLEFQSDQPQNLFDRLPEHCSTLQELIILSELSDIRFLYRMEHLILLEVICPVDSESIQKVFEANEFLSEFIFNQVNQGVELRVEQPKRFKVRVGFTSWEAPDLDAAIEFITVNSRPNKRKAEDLLELPEPVHQPATEQIVQPQADPPVHQPPADVFDPPQVPHDPLLAGPVSRPEIQVHYPVQYTVYYPVQNIVLHPVQYPVRYIVYYRV